MMITPGFAEKPGVFVFSDLAGAFGGAVWVGGKISEDFYPSGTISSLRLSE